MVKVRGQGDEDDHHFIPNFSSPGEYEDVSPSFTAKVPKSYVPNTASSFPDEIPNTLIRKISSLQGPEKCSKKIEDDNVKEKLGACSILRPRAVLSSPDNDLAIGNKNKHKTSPSSVTKNRKAVQNRHSLCKIVPRTTENSPNAKKSTEEPDETNLGGKKGPVSAAPTQKRRAKTEKPDSTRIREFIF